MKSTHTPAQFEKLNASLNDEETLKAYKTPYDGYRPSFIPQLLGDLLVECGNMVYGEHPSYLKFRAVEIIARVPYHSWASAMYTLLTLHFADEERAMRLSNVAKFSRLAQDNETMHVVVVSHCMKGTCEPNLFLHTLIPVFFSFFYFWASYILFLVRPRYSYELNYLFESHAFSQYDEFIRTHEAELKSKTMTSPFLKWYGRKPANQYEFFRSVRNDEIIHRNSSIEQIGK